MFSNKVFDVLKWICMVFIGAVGILYSGLAEVWNLPLGYEVGRTLSLLQVFLGTLLGISTIQYKHGQVQSVTQEKDALEEELLLNLDNSFENFDQEEFKED